MTSKNDISKLNLQDENQTTLEVASKDNFKFYIEKIENMNSKFMKFIEDIPTNQTPTNSIQKEQDSLDTGPESNIETARSQAPDQMMINTPIEDLLSIRNELEDFSYSVSMLKSEFSSLLNCQENSKIKYIELYRSNSRLRAEFSLIKNENAMLKSLNSQNVMNSDDRSFNINNEISNINENEFDLFNESQISEHNPFDNKAEKYIEVDLDFQNHRVDCRESITSSQKKSLINEIDISYSDRLLKKQENEFSEMRNMLAEKLEQQMKDSNQICEKLVTQINQLKSQNEDYRIQIQNSTYSQKINDHEKESIMAIFKNIDCMFKYNIYIKDHNLETEARKAFNIEYFDNPNVSLKSGAEHLNRCAEMFKDSFKTLKLDFNQQKQDTDIIQNLLDLLDNDDEQPKREKNQVNKMKQLVKLHSMNTNFGSETNSNTSRHNNNNAKNTNQETLKNKDESLKTNRNRERANSVSRTRTSTIIDSKNLQANDKLFGLINKNLTNELINLTGDTKL